MGADLYIKKLHTSRAANLHNSKAYFRDSYNMSNVLWTLNLSWWRDVLPVLDEQLELRGQKLQHFRDQIASAKQRLPTSEELNTNGVHVAKTGENSIQAWHDYYIKKRRELLTFFGPCNRESVANHLFAVVLEGREPLYVREIVISFRLVIVYFMARAIRMKILQGITGIKWSEDTV